MVRESPAEDKFMLETERNYLKQAVEAPRDEKVGSNNFNRLKLGEFL